MRVTKVMGKKSKDTNQTRSGIALNTFEIYESDKETWVEKLGTFKNVAGYEHSFRC